MSRLATSFVLGYHGCDHSVARQAIGGSIALMRGERSFDWLGPGAYFWEADPRRALECAQWKAQRGEIDKPAVVGAVIDLRNCLDLMSRTDLALVRQSHRAYVRAQRESGLSLPRNRSVRGQPNVDRVLRFLDCAVIRHLHDIIAAQPKEARTIEPFDTVRGMFTEGGPLYPGSNFRQRSHVQIAVCNEACILGLFLPRPDPAAASA